MKLFRYLGIVLMAGVLFTSCSKENDVTEEIKEESIETTLTIEVGNRSITTDAYALYCNLNGKEFISLSNNTELLGTEISAELVEDDFLFIYATDENEVETVAIGAGVFGESTSGIPGLNFSLAEVDYTLDNVSESTVEGSMEGDFTVVDAEGNTVILPYSVSFNAEVVGTSDVCD